MSSTKFGSILIFASYVVGTCNTRQIYSCICCGGGSPLQELPHTNANTSPLISIYKTSTQISRRVGSWMDIWLGRWVGGTCRIDYIVGECFRACRWPCYVLFSTYCSNLFFSAIPASAGIFFVFVFLYVHSFLFYFLCFFFPINLRLTCVCVVIGTTCNIYVVVFTGWQAV